MLEKNATLHFASIKSMRKQYVNSNSHALFYFGYSLLFSPLFNVASAANVISDWTYCLFTSSIRTAVSVYRFDCTEIRPGKKSQGKKIDEGGGGGGGGRGQLPE